MSNIAEVVADTESSLSKLANELAEAERAAHLVGNKTAQNEVLLTVHNAQQLVPLAREFLVIVDNIYSHMPSQQQRQYEQEFEQVELHIHDLRIMEPIGSVLRSSLQDDSINLIRRWTRNSSRVVSSFASALRTGIDFVLGLLEAQPVLGNVDHMPFVAGLREIIRALESEYSVGQIRRANTEAQEVLEKVKVTASATADAKLGEYFKTHGDSERAAARLLRYAASSLLMVTALGAAAIVFFLQDKGLQGGIWQQLAKLSVVLPLGILAGYLARESSKHRAASQWAEEMRVQLLTFDTFVEAMDPDDAKSLRQTFGMRVFAARPAVRTEDKESPTPIDMTKNMVDILRSPNEQPRP